MKKELMWEVERPELDDLVAEILLFSSSFCMDVEEERDALNDVLVTELLNRYIILPREDK